MYSVLHCQALNKFNKLCDLQTAIYTLDSPIHCNIVIEDIKPRKTAGIDN